MIAILAAMNKELTSLLESMDEVTTVTFASKTFHVGRLGGRFVVLAQSGIGKVNAAMTAAAVLSKYDCECLINTGVSGGLSPVRPGDLVLADRLVSFDADVTAIDPELVFGQIYGEPPFYTSDPRLVQLASNLLHQSGERFCVGTIASGDQFVTRLATLKNIRDVESNIVACDMEAQAVAQVAHHFDVPFVLLRGVSDIVESADQTEVYQGGVEAIARRTASFVAQFIAQTPWKRS
jgi:adenosylhomocysteine nucleosidase